MAKRSKTAERILIQLEAETQLFTKKMDKASKLLGKVEKDTKRTSMAFSGMSRSAANMGKALVAGLSIQAVSGFIKKALDAADAIDKVSSVAGLGAEEFQRLSYAAGLGGLAQTKFNGAMQTFAKRTGEALQGIGPLASYLKKYDNQLYENIRASKNQSEAFDLVADAVGKAGTATEKAAIVSAAFSKANIQMVNSLTNGSKAIREVGKDINVISANSVKAAAEFKDRWSTAMDKISAGAYDMAISFADAIDFMVSADDKRSLRSLESQIISIKGEINRENADPDPFGMSDAYIDGRMKRLAELEKEVEAAKKRMGENIIDRSTLDPDPPSGTGEPDKAALAAAKKALAERLKLADEMGNAMVEQWRSDQEAMKSISEEVDPYKPLFEKMEKIRLLIEKYPEFMNAGTEALFIHQETIDEMLAKSGEVIQKKAEEVSQMGRLMADAISDFAAGAAQNFVDFAMTGEQSFAEMTKSILANLAKMILQAQILKALGGLGLIPGAAPGAASVRGAPGAASVPGGAAGPSPMTNAGGAGITRGAANAIGATGGGVSITVNNNAPGVDVTAKEQSNGNGGKDIVLFIESTIAGYFDTGKGDNLMGSVYGGRRVPR